MNSFVIFRAVLGVISFLLLRHETKAQGQDGHWVDVWTNMPQLVETSNLPPSPFLTSNSVFSSTTLRQTVRVSVGAERFRIVFSNTFGGTDLPITSVNFALPTGGQSGVAGIQTGTVVFIKFGGATSVTIPKGKTITSDELTVSLRAQQVITITMYLQQGQSGNNIDGHPGSRTTTWLQQGNHATDATLTGTGVAHWYLLSSVQAWTPADVGSFVILGDSITDGRGSDDNKNNRWPDLVLARLQSNGINNVAICNQAAGGNRVLQDGLGPSLVSRYQRDALGQPGVKWVMIFEGVNDIGTAGTDQTSQTNVGNQLIAAFTQIASDVKKAGIPIFAATITPFSAPGGASQQAYSDPNREATRQKVNNWIKTSGTFDAVIDFDKFIGNPSTPSQLNSIYNSGDYLHPNVAGYQHIANLFPLNIFGSSSSPGTTVTASPTSSTTTIVQPPPTTIATTTVQPPPSTTATASGPTQTQYGQCGGLDWKGPTTCSSPYKCVLSNNYYSQCL